MEKQLISYETANLAKEKGFNELCSGYYISESTHSYSGTLCTNAGLATGCFAAPTQALLQKWLREEHNIDVLPMIEGASNYEVHVFLGRTRVTEYGEIRVHPTPDNVFGYGIYEEAMEKGLVKALKLLP